jgi:DNA-binding MarR family transcriptional regulator
VGGLLLGHGSSRPASYQRGWLQRRANTGNSRSWLVRLTPAGWPRCHLALPYAKVACNRLEHSLGDRRVDIITLRRQIQLLSNGLRSLLPTSDLALWQIDRALE